MATASANPHVLAIDLGTSGAKVGLVSGRLTVDYVESMLDELLAAQQRYLSTCFGSD